MEVHGTPGHNSGCLTIVLGDIIFMRDAYIPGVDSNTQLPMQTMNRHNNLWKEN